MSQYFNFYQKENYMHLSFIIILSIEGHFFQFELHSRLYIFKFFSRENMTQPPTLTPLEETSELTFMRSKVSTLKQKLQLPFPYFYSLVPKEEELYEKRVQQFKEKLKQNTVPIEEVALFQPVGLGRIEGTPGTQAPVNILTKYFEYQNKQFWQQFIKQKLTLKSHGLPKQKSYTMWQLKDIDQLKQFYNIEQIKKQRKIIKQYSTLYKIINKFVEKFEKIQVQNDVMEAYEEYKKVEQEDSKMNKIMAAEKGTVKKGLKAVDPPIQVQPVEQANKVESMKMENQEQNEQRKLQNIPEQVNKDINNDGNQDIEQNNQKQKEQAPKPTQAKQSKKKSEGKQQGSSKKQAKVVVDKKQQQLSKYKSLDFFFKKKAEPQTPRPALIDQNPQQQDKTTIFLQQLGISAAKQNIPDLCSLKLEFLSHKKKIEEGVKTCYVTINMLRSRLELYDFPVRDTRVNFIEPYQQKQNIRYDDSSDQYSELVADSINEQMVQEQQQEMEESESNSAIVSDSYCEYKSSHIMSSSQSSDEEQEKKPKPQMIKSVERWFSSSREIERKQRLFKFQMICLIEEAFPILVKDLAQENSNEVTAAQKVQMYREIHGSYTPKQILIKKINTIVENKISMNKLSTLIKDICEKKGTQRVLKTEIIRQLAEQLAETYPNLESELEQLRNERQTARNMEAEAKREQKQNERDQKIQKLILEYQNEGEITTNLLLAYLRSNEIKLIKHELNSILKTKQGQKWDHIRNQIKKSKLVRGRPKKIKAAKQQVQEQLINAHKPLDEMFKQNQLDMMNRPKKERKNHENVDGQMIDENEGQAMDVEEQDYHEPSDDESFDLKKKPKKNSKGSKRKSIVKISPLLPPVRRNPKRNKKKPKRFNEKEQEKNENSNNDEGNKEEQIGNIEVNEEEGNEVNGEIENEVNEQVENKLAKESQMQQRQEKQQIEDKVEAEMEMEMDGKIGQEKQEENQLKLVSPVRQSIEQKKQQENVEKTANKIGSSQSAEHNPI